MSYQTEAIMPSDAAIAMFSLVDSLGRTKWRTRRTDVYDAMRSRGYSPEEIDRAEDELIRELGAVEHRGEYLEWTRPSLYRNTETN